MDNNNNAKTSNLGGGGKKFLLVSKQQKPVTFRLWGDETSGNVDEGIGFPYTDYTINPGEDIIEKCPNIVGGYEITHSFKYFLSFASSLSGEITEEMQLEFFKQYYKIMFENDIIKGDIGGIIREDGYNTCLMEPITIENKFTYRPNTDVIIYPDYNFIFLIDSENCPNEYKSLVEHTIIYRRVYETHDAKDVIFTSIIIPNTTTEINDPMFSNFGNNNIHYDGIEFNEHINIKCISNVKESTQLSNIYIPMTSSEFKEYRKTYAYDEKTKTSRLTSWDRIKIYESGSYFDWCIKVLNDGEMDVRYGVNYTGNFVFTDKTVPSTDFIQKFGRELDTPPNNEIWYYSVDESVLTKYDGTSFGANIVSNTYENGKGIIKFDGDVTSIGEGVFDNNKNIDSISLPESVTSIGSRAFYGCTNLSYISIPNSVTTIGEQAFCYCTSLTSITIPNSVTSIGEYAFCYCTSLTSITIPNSVTSIGDYAFYYCTSLTSITIPNSVTSIGEYAFRSCTGITSITIPNSVTSIGVFAFRNCSKLTTLTVESSTPPTFGSEMLSGCSKLSAIKVPASSADAYKTANGWKNYADKIVAISE